MRAICIGYSQFFTQLVETVQEPPLKQKPSIPAAKAASVQGVPDSISHYSSKLVDKCLRRFTDWKNIDPSKLSKIISHTATDVAQRLCNASESDLSGIAKAALKRPYQNSILKKEQWEPAYRYLHEQLQVFVSQRKDTKT